MRIFREEFGHRYETYSFGYTLHAEIESTDDPAQVYQEGFLPYSADPAIHNRFYLARSVRVPLSTFTLSSENRRILRKFDGHYTYTYIERENLANEPSFIPLVLEYFKTRHGEKVMDAERLMGILSSVLPFRIVRYEKETVAIGYVIEVFHPRFSHYWYSAYDLSLAGTSFGMWLLLDAARRAKAEGRDYIYMGTAYGQKGRYKTNLCPIEFWDGTSWNTDTKQLRTLIENDGDVT